MEFLKPIFSQNYYGKFCFSFEIWWGAHWKIFIWCLYVSFTYIYQNQAPICLAHIFSGKTSSQVQCELISWLKSQKKLTLVTDLETVVCKIIRETYY